VTQGLDQPDKLALVRRELVMASSEGVAEKGQRSIALMKDSAEPMPEASQSTTNGLSKSGIWSMGPIVSARWRAWNASFASAS
jgi:hypothetical protein